MYEEEREKATEVSKGTDEYLYELSDKKLKDMKSFLDTGIKYSIESNKKTLKKLDTPKNNKTKKNK